MGHQAKGASLQLVGFVLGTVGWIGSAIAMGLVQWRVWQVSSVEITSGVAWVGIWRVCFYSQVLITPPYQRMSCQRLDALDRFIPFEIVIAQGLLPVAVLIGALGKIANVYGLRNVYFGEEQQPRRTWLAFVVGGAFHILACVCVVIPAAWNMRSVVSNQEIIFPPHFHLPGTPQSQVLGVAVYIAIFSSALLFLAGVFLVSYSKFSGVHPSAEELPDSSSLVSGYTMQSESSLFTKSISKYSLSSDGVDNPTFNSEENL
ncbi:claudin-34 [Scyliorhinus canicula]|uniref:claudin-34 n=1 Tax=Scyliorhinus canicula TaxID=7830 RepID=UPI0018F4DFDD|nr:claudin-34 [Scyliorhinus canicula]